MRIMSALLTVATVRVSAAWAMPSEAMQAVPSSKWNAFIRGLPSRPEPEAAIVFVVARVLRYERLVGITAPEVAARQSRDCTSTDTFLHSLD